MKKTGTHYWWIWWNKKIGMALLAIIALGACTEVPIKQVEKCAKVVDVKMFKTYFLGMPVPNSVGSYALLDNGKNLKLDLDGRLDEGWFKISKKMKIGGYHCWMEYERIR